MKKIEMRWELNGLRWMPSEWQSTLFQLEITRTKQGDHSPGWNVFFAIGNFCIIEFGRYNLRGQCYTQRMDRICCIPQNVQ
jgi:hypothetical protein